MPPARPSPTSAAASRIKSYDWTSARLMKKPEVLNPGDKVAIVAPGATFDRRRFKAGVSGLKRMGLRPIFAPHLLEKDFIFAGTLEHRVDDLWSLMRRSDIRAVWCVRGGWGCYAVAQKLAERPAPRTPKIFIGHSDVTALHLLITQKWKWPVFHGPAVDRLGSQRQPAAEILNLRRTLFDPLFRLRVDENLRILGRRGAAEGLLTGGTLTLAAASLGSFWEIDTRGKILFLEDVGERAYRIDRMLVQLRSAGKFDRVKGIVFGDFTDCDEPDGRRLWPIVLRRHFEKAPFPVLIGIPAGHGALRLTLPLGVKVRIWTSPRPLLEALDGPFE